MPTFVGDAPVYLPAGPVPTPPTSGGEGSSAPAVTHEFSGTGSGLQAFIDATPDGGVIGLVDSTTYDIGSDMIVLDGRNALSIVGRNAVIYQSVLQTDEVFQVNGGSSDIALYNLGITGSNPDPGTWDVTYEHNHGISLRAVTNFEASGCFISNVSGDGLYIAGLLDIDRWSKNVRFHHGSISGTGRMGVSITDGGRSVVVDFNAFADIAYYLFDIEPNGLTIEGIAAGAIDARVSDNTISGQPYGTGTGGQPVGYAMAITGSSGGGPGNQIQFIRNVFTDGVMRVGVFNNGGSRQDIVVSNNTASDTFTADGDISKLVSFNGVSGGAIQNNTQPCTVDADFYILSGSSGISVSGNVV